MYTDALYTKQNSVSKAA